MCIAIEYTLLGQNKVKVTAQKEYCITIEISPDRFRGREKAAENVLHIVGIFGKIDVLTVRLYTFPILVCRIANGYSVLTVKLAGALPFCSSPYVSPSPLSPLGVFPDVGIREIES